MAIIIDGKKVADEIKAELKIKTEELVNTKGIQPCIALMLVGDNPSSKVYVNSKEKDCHDIGYKSIVLRLASETTQDEVIKIIQNWNNDSSIHGILVQLPLPPHINETKVISTISPSKDVDGLHPANFGRLVIGIPGFLPCTPAGIMELLKRYNIATVGKHVVVLGRSNIVGKPIANLLYQKNENANSIVTICHTAAPDLRYYTKQADILVIAIGSPKIIKAEDVKEGVVIIDVGINRVEDLTSPKGFKIVGDADFEGILHKAYAITPVPGGVGLMTRAMLMTNTFKSASGEVKYE